MIRRLLDSDGEEVKEGDTIRFGYGIPPILVIARIEKHGGKLWAITRGHKPEISNARGLHRMNIAFWKE